MILPENWSFYIEEDDDYPMSIFVNIGLSKIAPIPNYPVLLCISINYTSKDNGFPIDEDLDKLCSVEDELTTTLSTIFKAIHTGTITSNGTRDIFIYFKNEVKIEKILSAHLQDFPLHQYHFSINENWDSFWGLLMPSREQYQSIQNRNVLYDMEKHGDLLQKAREVRHWIYFNSKKDQNSFEKTVKNQNFKVLKKSFNKKNPLPFEIIISRIDKIDYDNIDTYTINLYKIAEGLNGNYDGWECETFIDKS